MTNHMIETGHTFCSCLLSPELLGLLIIYYSGADAKSGFIFCSECDDFIFDDTIDELYLTAVVSVEERNTKFQGTF